MLQLATQSNALDSDRPAIEASDPADNTLDVTIVGTGRNDVLYGVSSSLTLDQESTAYTGGLSARTLPGYSIWQSFTAGESGRLEQIDVGLFSFPIAWNGHGDLKVFAGDGTDGSLLYAAQVNVHVPASTPGVIYDHWSVNAKVVAGHAYTFEFTPDADSVPDPYGVALGEHNPYAGGEMGLVDPGGTDRTDYDWDFKTFLKGSPDDALSGDGGNDKLFGLLGNDTLSGGTGSDLLVGGRGADVLSGGAGNDVFRYESVKDSVPEHADLITDLSVGDRIDLSRIDADTTKAGDQAFHVIHGSLTGHAGELLLVFHPGQDLTSVRGDVNGDGVADFRIDIAGDWADFNGFVL